MKLPWIDRSPPAGPAIYRHTRSPWLPLPHLWLQLIDIVAMEGGRGSELLRAVVICAAVLMAAAAAGGATSSVVVVGMAQCAGCGRKGMGAEAAFKGLKVAITCKKGGGDGEYESKAVASLDGTGAFAVPLPADVGASECLAQLQSAASGAPCPGQEPSRIVPLLSEEAGEGTFVAVAGKATRGRTAAAPECASANICFPCRKPFFAHRRMRPLPEYGTPVPACLCTPTPAPGCQCPSPMPVYGTPVPEYYPPPAPDYGTPTPVYDPPVYGTPTPVYAPPVYGTPTPVYAPPVYGTPTPVYAPPTAPVYGTPTPDCPPEAPEYGTPTPVYAPPTAPVYGTPAPRCLCTPRPDPGCQCPSPTPVYGTPSPRCLCTPTPEPGCQCPTPVYVAPPTPVPVYGTPSPRCLCTPSPAPGCQCPAPTSTPVYGTPYPPAAPVYPQPAPEYGAPECPPEYGGTPIYTPPGHH